MMFLVYELTQPSFLIGFNAGNSNQDSSKFLSKVATKNELFTRLHEDPFLRIKQEEKKVKLRDLFRYHPMTYLSNSP